MIWENRGNCTTKTEATIYIAQRIKDSAQTIVDATPELLKTILDEIDVFAFGWCIPFNKSEIRDIACKCLDEEEAYEESDDWEASDQNC